MLQFPFGGGGGAKLREENEILKQRLREYVDHYEPIPFHEVEEETEFREVVTQTVSERQSKTEEEKQSEIESMIHRLESQEEEKRALKTEQTH